MITRVDSHIGTLHGVHRRNSPANTRVAPGHDRLLALHLPCRLVPREVLVPYHISGLSWGLAALGRCTHPPAWSPERASPPCHSEFPLVDPFEIQSGSLQAERKRPSRRCGMGPTETIYVSLEFSSTLVRVDVFTLIFTPPDCSPGPPASPIAWFARFLTVSMVLIFP